DSIERNNMQLTHRAAALLVPSLAHCREIVSAAPEQTEAMQHLVAVTCRLLDDSAVLMEKRKEQVLAEIYRRRRANKTLMSIRRRQGQPAAYRRLDSNL